MIKKTSIILIIITITGWLIYLFPEEAISPGDLLEKHRHLEESCANCHDTFQGASGEKCAQCHAPDKIGIVQTKDQINGQEKKSLSFHNKLKPDTCTACHREHQGRLTSNQTIQFSHEMLGHNNVKNCIECHQPPANSMHQKSGQDCTQCHKTTNWASAEIDHSTYFRFDRDHRTACTACHPNSDYKAYTCYGCHEHSPRKIEKEHTKEGIRDYANCAECHRSGDEHDIRKPKRVKNRVIEPGDQEIKKHDRKSKYSRDDSRRSKRHSDDHDDTHEDEDH